MYITKDGKMKNETMISNERYEQMSNNGYCYCAVGCAETAQEAYDRLISNGWNKVRIYSQATRIRGYHKLYAMAR